MCLYVSFQIITKMSTVQPRINVSAAVMVKYTNLEMYCLFRQEQDKLCRFLISPPVKLERRCFDTLRMKYTPTKLSRTPAQQPTLCMEIKMSHTQVGL